MPRDAGKELELSTLLRAVPGCSAKAGILTSSVVLPASFSDDFFTGRY